MFAEVLLRVPRAPNEPPFTSRNDPAFVWFALPLATVEEEVLARRLPPPGACWFRDWPSEGLLTDRIVGATVMMEIVEDGWEGKRDDDGSGPFEL